MQVKSGMIRPVTPFMHVIAPILLLLMTGALAGCKTAGSGKGAADLQGRQPIPCGNKVFPPHYPGSIYPQGTYLERVYPSDSGWQPEVMSPRMLSVGEGVCLCRPYVIVEERLDGSARSIKETSYCIMTERIQDNRGDRDEVVSTSRGVTDPYICTLEFCKAKIMNSRKPGSCATDIWDICGNTYSGKEAQYEGSGQK
jgi:hypothetical protein